MSDPASPVDDIDPAELADAIRAAGVAGAGGAGFPSYVKWTDPDATTALLVNHQESEPNCHADVWLGRERADDLAWLVDALLETTFETVVVGTKASYREAGLTDALEAATGATVHGPEDLPVDPDSTSGVVIAATPDVYTYSEESVLLMVTAGVGIGDDLPTDHGWIVHNTESLYNVARAVRDGEPVTRKYVHVDGETPRHRCLEVPVGTPATALLEAAGVEDGALGPGQVLVDGGPGWCYEIERPPDEFGVRKRTNAVLVMDREVVDEHTQPDGQIDVLHQDRWTARDHETEPTPLAPDLVRIPLITNEAYAGFVEPSRPVVEPGDSVSRGDVVARRSPDGIGIPQHASIDGTVADVTDSHVVVER